MAKEIVIDKDMFNWLVQERPILWNKILAAFKYKEEWREMNCLFNRRRYNN